MTDRHRKYIESEEWRNIAYGFAASGSLNFHITYSAAMIMLSLVVVLCSLLTRDRINRVDRLQLASAIGRRIYVVQFAAMMLSSLVLVTTQVALAMVFFESITGISAFWDNGMCSFLSSDILSFPCTLGQYILASMSLVYVMGLGLAMLLFVFSFMSDNYVSLLLKAIPAFAAVGIGCVVLIFHEGMFSSSNPIFRITGKELVEPVLAIAILVAGATVGIATLIRARKADLVI